LNATERVWAVALLEKGRELGSAKKYEEALVAFQEAAGIDQYSPDPHYEVAITLMHLRRYPEAVDAYGRVESLAPGWYHCRSEMWLARQLATGNITHDVFLTLRELEDGNALPLERAHMAEAALRQAPSVALLHLKYGESLESLGERQQAQAEYRKGLRCADEPDVQTSLLVRLAGLLESENSERQRLLEQAITINGNLISCAMARVLMGPCRVH
jgi:tetratricopeptide (TPR) repeat protein